MRVRNFVLGSFVVATIVAFSTTQAATSDSSKFLVAENGTVLVAGGVHRGSDEPMGTITAFQPDGRESWKAEFVGEWPMQIATLSDLVVATVGQGSGVGSGNGVAADDAPAIHDVRVVGLALADGAVRWSVDLGERVPIDVFFAPSGSWLYVEVYGHGGGAKAHHAGQSSSPSGFHQLLALRRDGTLLWTLEIGIDDSNVVGEPILEFAE